MHVLSRCVFSGIVTRFRLTALISCGSLYCIPACLQNSNSVRCNQRPRFNLIWPILYSLTYCIWRNLKPFILIHSLALSRERFSLITGSHNKIPVDLGWHENLDRFEAKFYWTPMFIYVLTLTYNKVYIMKSFLYPPINRYYREVQDKVQMFTKNTISFSLFYVNDWLNFA